MPPITPQNGPNVIDALREISCHFGYDPECLSVEQKLDIAVRLSRMANREEAWGWRYIHNVLAGKVNASREMVDAINRLGASVDGAPDVLARSTKVVCLAVGTVHPGSLILSDSRRCKNPACGLWFVPTASNQVYHCQACKRIWEKEYKRIKRQEQHGY